MVTRLRVWYRKQRTIKQLIISFLLYWFFWFIGSLLGDALFYNEENSLTGHFLRATWMAFFMATAFGWKKIKSLFQRNDATIL